VHAPPQACPLRALGPSHPSPAYPPSLRPSCRPTPRCHPARAAGKGAGGKLGTSGGTLLTQYLLKNKGALHNPAEEDVRAAILRHAGEMSAALRCCRPCPAVEAAGWAVHAAPHHKALHKCSLAGPLACGP
jgi:hypothetical protein